MPPDDDAPLEVLRGRVYGPSATEADRERYRAALAEGDATPGPAPGSAPVRAAHPLPRSAVIAAPVVAVVVVGVLVGVLALLPRPAPAPEGLPADAIAVSPAARERAVRALVAGRTPVLSAALLARALPARSSGRVAGPERAGTGPASVALHAPAGGGTIRVTVVLVTGTDTTGGWTAYDLPDDAVDGTHLARIAERAGAQPAGVPTAVTYAAASDARPARLDIDLPVGVRWAVAVAYDG